MPDSSTGTRPSSKRAPRPASLVSSGKAFDSPPAPTSWIARIGLPEPAGPPESPSAAHWLITSCARRSISGLPRWTESKSSSTALAPVAIELAALPPIPIRMPGPPSWINRLPAGNAILLVCPAAIVPRPPAIMIGLW